LTQNKFSIVDVHPGDVENLVPLELEYMQYHSDLDDYFDFTDDMSKKWRQYILKEVLPDKAQKIYAAVVANKFIGYIDGQISQRAPIYKIKLVGSIGTIFVQPEFRKRGIATALALKLMDWFTKNQVRYIEHPISSRNEPSLSFWKKLGFEDYMVWFRKNI
jgi:ribosomal protein S18 acetylase RimI-like enzyme